MASGDGTTSARGMHLRGLFWGLVIYLGVWLAAALFTWSPVVGALLRAAAIALTWVAATVGLGAVLTPLGQDLEKGRLSEAARSLPMIVNMSPSGMVIRLDDNEPALWGDSMLLTVNNAPRAGAALKFDTTLTSVAALMFRGASGLLNGDSAGGAGENSAAATARTGCTVKTKSPPSNLGSERVPNCGVCLFPDFSMTSRLT